MHVTQHISCLCHWSYPIFHTLFRICDSSIPNLIGNPLTTEEIPAFAGMTTMVSAVFSVEV